MPVRGHYLSWATMNESYKFPRDYEAEPDRLWPDLRDHIKRMLDFTAGRIPEWDAVNHIIGWGPKTFADITGGADVYAKTIRLGRKLTDASMWINEGNVIAGSVCREPYLEVLDTLIERDAKPDGVGFMGHFGPDELIDPARIVDICNRFAARDVKLQMTELDIDAGGDEQLQADYYRDVLIAAFSHPDMQGVVLWGFWEGNHFQPERALWREDWSMKPAGRAWEPLIFDRWWTEAEGKSDAAGRYTMTGFHGQYTITVRHDGETRTTTTSLPAGGQTVMVTLD